MGEISSFSFLSPRHFVVSRYGRNENPSLPSFAQLEVYDFLARRSEGSTIPHLQRTYELPSLRRGCAVNYMITRSDPSPSSFSQDFASCGRPFYTAQTSRLLVVSINCGGDVLSYVLFVHHSSLLKGLETESELEDVVVPWENWGPTETRLIRTEFNEPSWVCYVHGTRYVRLGLVGVIATGIPSCRLQVLDFNILAPMRGEFKSPVSGQSV
jgi:hypothetical protein